MSNYVFVIDTDKQPCDPVHPAQARLLLNQKTVAVFLQYPFTIILKEKQEAEPKSLAVKIDPGSKTTGLALLSGETVIWGAELSHRGQQIKADLDSRCAIRRGRRNRKTRYRPARFLNRQEPDGWLAPSLQHRVDTTLTWVNKLIRYCPVVGISQELVRCDLQKRATKSGNICWGKGHGTRQMCRTDKFGFPSCYVPRNKFVKGFQTGDIVKAVVTSGKKVGEYLGRVAVRSQGSFNITTVQGLIQGISHKYCKHIHKKDGYSYAS
jgi:hypothetical protein